ncbi:hypothetical protein NPIL_195171 [Nephila pilipes]|uniref:SURP motif domain-containing protein n=1 Tax=Nephila pilipes TaxID=299642 RepID=A0A8X6NMG2_NEPPI|nr:hypothetical protein NPIL_195171 [Nephila pilipes]
MADAGVSWSRNPCAGPSDPNEKLFVFGYSCKIFPDDEKAAFVDQGNHLIPWMGDESLMIDRYDVRGYLHDLKQYEPKTDEYEDPFAEEEKFCDEERYRSLRSDMSEEQLYQEEELKRLRAAIANDGAYHEIGFTYDNTDQYVEPELCKVEEPEDELYQVPEGLTVPKEMEVPYNMKIHTIIEKTAEFVSEQGGQMEIIIKMKQQSNPQFAFMHLDNPLYPYYKHLVKVIKSGDYKPAPRRKVSRSEDEDDDGHYLHPSLMSGRQEAVPKFTVPTLNFRRSHDDSYSVLVRNLQKHHKDETSSPQQDSHDGSDISSPASDDYNNELKKDPTTSEPYILPPPPDMQPIVDKMAEYVAKNGEDFEIIVKNKKDKRFDFLHSWHEFYNYYIYKRNVAKAKMQDNNALKTENAKNQITPENDNHFDLQKPIVQESGPVLYSNIQLSDPPQEKSEEINVPTVPTVPVIDSNDALCTQVSLEAISEPQPTPQEVLKEETSDFVDMLDSLKDDKAVDEPKMKPSKVLKGPISFSLKSKDTDAPSEKAKLTPLLMDDSEDESSEEGKHEKEISAKRRKSVEEQSQTSSSKNNATEVEVKTPKLSYEFLVAKQAEGRIRDKLFSTARERLFQQRREKQQQMEQQKREEQMKKEKLQQLDQQKKEEELKKERKKKLALFLKMMVQTKPDSSENVKNSSSGPNSKFWGLSETPAVAAQGSGILFHGNKTLLTAGCLPGIKAEWSSDSVSEHSGEEEPISVIGEKLSSDPEVVEEPVITKTERKKKKRKRSRSKSRERSRSKRSKTPRHSRDKHRSRSLSRKQEKKKEKKLPAAYALSARSRSRSRSPRRHRPSFGHWNRRR